MTGSPHDNKLALPAEAAPGLDALLAGLRRTGADKFDPVRMRYIEALARRAAAQEGAIKRLLDMKAGQAIAALEEGFKQARCQAAQAASQGSKQYPAAAGDLQRLLDAGDLKGVRRHIACLKAGEQSQPLAALLRQLEQEAAGIVDRPAGGQAAVPAGSRPELKTIRNSRNTWVSLSVDKQVAQAWQQAPANAGPINSHMLLLRSLALMRDISPDYLNRFISYADALLCLDESGMQDKPKKADKQKKADKPKKAGAARPP